LPSVRASTRASFQAGRRSSSRALVAQLTTWNGSAQRIAPAARWLTTSAIQPAASAETWVIWAHRVGPSASKKRFKVGLSRPAAAQISRPLSWSTTTVVTLVGDLVDADTPQSGKPVFLLI
jgi:hypothetical protein